MTAFKFSDYPELLRGLIADASFGMDVMTSMPPATATAVVEHALCSIVIGGMIAKSVGLDPLQDLVCRLRDVCWRRARLVVGDVAEEVAAGVHGKPGDA